MGASPDVQTCPRHRWIRRGAEVLIDKTTSYEHDIAAQFFVATFHGGATLDSIAEAMGVSRERVRQIQESALEKVRALGLGAFLLDPEDPEERRSFTSSARHDESGDDDEGADEEEAPRATPAERTPEPVDLPELVVDFVEPTPW